MDGFAQKLPHFSEGRAFTLLMIERNKIKDLSPLVDAAKKGTDAK